MNPFCVHSPAMEEEEARSYQEAMRQKVNSVLYPCPGCGRMHKPFAMVAAFVSQRGERLKWLASVALGTDCCVMGAQSLDSLVDADTEGGRGSEALLDRVRSFRLPGSGQMTEVERRRSGIVADLRKTVSDASLAAALAARMGKFGKPLGKSSGGL